MEELNRLAKIEVVCIMLWDQVITVVNTCLICMREFIDSRNDIFQARRVMAREKSPEDFLRAHWTFLVFKLVPFVLSDFIEKKTN